MTKEEINKFLANTKVYVNGKSGEIQEKLFSLGYKWYTGVKKICDTESPFLFIYSNMSFNRSNDMECFSSNKHREITTEEILSLELTEPEYRPFKNQEECWNEMLKHKPFGWLKAKSNGDIIFIGSVCNIKAVWIVLAIDETSSYSASKIFNDYVFADGTPFGIKKN